MQENWTEQAWLVTHMYQFECRLTVQIRKVYTRFTSGMLLCCKGKPVNNRLFDLPF